MQNFGVPASIRKCRQERSCNAYTFYFGNSTTDSESCILLRYLPESVRACENCSSGLRYCDSICTFSSKYQSTKLDKTYNMFERNTDDQVVSINSMAVIFSEVCELHILVIGDGGYTPGNGTGGGGGSGYIEEIYLPNKNFTLNKEIGIFIGYGNWTCNYKRALNKKST